MNLCAITPIPFQVVFEAEFLCSSAKYSVVITTTRLGRSNSTCICSCETVHQFGIIAQLRVQVTEERVASRSFHSRDQILPGTQ